MRQLLPCTRPTRFRSFPAALRVPGVYSCCTSWSGGYAARDVCGADSNAVCFVQADVRGATEQSVRSKLFRRPAYWLVLPTPHLQCFRPSPSPALPEISTLRGRGPLVNTTASSPQERSRLPRISLASFHGVLPHFLSDLQPPTGRGSRSAGDKETAPSDNVSAPTDLQFLSPLPTASSEVVERPPLCDETVHVEGPCDLLRLQSRYDALLLNPLAFSMQVQLLHARIQSAQQQHGKCAYMKKLQLLQERIRTPGTGACLHVHPLVYAAFCIYSPSHIHIAAAMRIGAAEHFLGQYVKARSNSRADRRGTFLVINGRGRAAAEQWLAQTSLKCICIYPLEALPNQLRLFPLTAPQRLAAWENILSRGLAG